MSTSAAFAAIPPPDPFLTPKSFQSLPTQFIHRLSLHFFYFSLRRFDGEGDNFDSFPTTSYPHPHAHPTFILTLPGSSALPQLYSFLSSTSFQSLPTQLLLCLSLQLLHFPFQRFDSERDSLDSFPATIHPTFALTLPASAIPPYGYRPRLFYSYPRNSYLACLCSSSTSLSSDLIVKVIALILSLGKAVSPSFCASSFVINSAITRRTVFALEKGVRRGVE